MSKLQGCEPFRFAAAPCFPEERRISEGYLLKARRRWIGRVESGHSWRYAGLLPVDLVGMEAHFGLMNPSYLDRITSSPTQCGGRPCIRGMRIRVKDVLEMLGAGMSEQDILLEFPYLEKEDIRAALQFAASMSDTAILRAA